MFLFFYCFIKDCIDQLSEQFSDSNRVKRLQGMKAEAIGRFDIASQIYETILDTDETNAVSSS